MNHAGSFLLPVQLRCRDPPTRSRPLFARSEMGLPHSEMVTQNLRVPFPSIQEEKPPKGYDHSKNYKNQARSKHSQPFSYQQYFIIFYCVTSNECDTRNSFAFLCFTGEKKENTGKSKLHGSLRGPTLVSQQAI